MKTTRCTKCGKRIVGYTDRHVNTMLAQHLIKHDNEKRAKEGTQ